MADLPNNAVWMLPDEFDDDNLVEAITKIWRNTELRTKLGSAATAYIYANHNPHHCSNLYTQAIEAAYDKENKSLFGFVNQITNGNKDLGLLDLPKLSLVLANNFPKTPKRHQFFLDVSVLVVEDAKTGIQRVVRALMMELIINPPADWVIHPIYVPFGESTFRYANKLTSCFLGITDDWVEDDPVQLYQGDVYISLDLNHHVSISCKHIFQEWRRRGVLLYAVVYDLLPATMPEVFPSGTNELHHQWLRVITKFDGALCISRAVADELFDWLQTFGQKRARPYQLNWFHLGSDLDNSAPSLGFPADANETLHALKSRPTFLMVGTMEPRKSYLQTLHAFDALWMQGADVNLIIVGKEGWKPLPDAQRRDIPQTVHALRNHPELGKRLFWLDGISDEYLELVYAHATCLIAASYDEGFGLPLIEAARHGLPLLVRDIPVFREVTAGHAHFFADRLEPLTITEAVEAWLEQYRQGKHQHSDAMPHQTWKDSTRQVLDAILGTTVPYKTWLPDGVRRYWGADPRLHTEVGQRTGRAIHTTGKAGMLIYGPYEHFEPGRYRMIVRGFADYLSGEEWLDIVCDQGSKKMAHFQLQEQGCGVWQEMRGLDIEVECADFEIRLWVTERTRLHLSEVEFKKIDDTYDQKFVVMNKSYSKDLEWSLALYRSWSKYSVRKASFFVIVPRKDVANFTQRFVDEMQYCHIAEIPIILSEEDVLGVADIRCPPDFSGWHVQQIIKLCFSKIGFSNHYLTLDSAMIFTKPFDYLDLYSDKGIFCTAATRVRKKEFYGNYLQVDEKGWLNDELVNLSQSLEAICRFMGNKTAFTHWYIAGNGFFDSECAKGLEAYARQNGVDGFVGLIRMAPYEFAWYGEYVFTQRQEQFMPKGPLIMQPCSDLESLADLYDGNFLIPEHFYGVLFQPPASERIDFNAINFVKIR